MSQQIKPELDPILTEEELQEEASKELATIQSYEVQLAELESALATNPQFTQFLEFQKKLREKEAEFWSKIKEQMLANNVKSVKGEWGWITIGETKSVKVVDESVLPKKYFKKQVDTQLLKDTVKLTGKLPAGVKEETTYKLMKKIKTPEKGNQ